MAIDGISWLCAVEGPAWNDCMDSSIRTLRNRTHALKTVYINKKSTDDDSLLWRSGAPDCRHVMNVLKLTQT